MKEDKHFFLPVMQYFTQEEQDKMLDEFNRFDQTLIHDKYRGIVEGLEKVASGLSRYECTVCGYVYDPVQGDPEHGIKPGTSFEELPDKWVDQPPSTGSSAPVVKVASNARKRTALAISSDVPKRFIGLASRICPVTWAATSLSGNALPMIGVSMGPGDTALTRIPRGRSSAANTRAKDRSAALAAPYAARVGIPLTLAIEVVRTTAPPRLISGASFWTAKNGPLAFRLNISS